MHALQVTPDVMVAYGTPMLQRRIEAMLPHHAALTDLALRLRAAEPGATVSNAGGWHSAGNIFEREEPGIRLLAQHVHAALQHMSMLVKQIAATRVAFEATLYGWINVNGAGDYNTPHCHPGGTWSGVYYIRTGSEVPDRPEQRPHPVHRSAHPLRPRPHARLCPYPLGRGQSGGQHAADLPGLSRALRAPVFRHRRAHHAGLQQLRPEADATPVSCDEPLPPAGL